MKNNVPILKLSHGKAENLTVQSNRRTFYATSPHWNICTAAYFCKPNNIFKHAGGGDSVEEVCEESFCREKFVLLFKKRKKSLI